jgi:hypothetical protein
MSGTVLGEIVSTFGCQRALGELPSDEVNCKQPGGTIFSLVGFNRMLEKKSNNSGVALVS